MPLSDIKYGCLLTSFNSCWRRAPRRQAQLQGPIRLRRQKSRRSSPQSFGRGGHDQDQGRGGNR